MKTKYGNAKINPNGYYQINSRKEGNNMKLLHRLVFEDYHDCKLDKKDVIHHIDGDKTNNHLANLICMSKKAHSKLHNTGEKHSKENKIKMSKANNTSGYYRVSKRTNKQYALGFIWVYTYFENGKRKEIANVDIKKLEKKVRSKRLKWIKFSDKKE